MKATRNKLRFKDLPKDFPGLCKVFMPRAIHDAVSYDNTLEVTDAMAVWSEGFSPDQENYFDILASLIEAYDKETVEWATVGPVEMLSYLLKENKMSTADLAALLGVTSSLVAKILRGQRCLTADHARTLGKRFNVSPGVFI